MECSNQKMMRQSKKEKDARKSPRKEKVDVKSEKVARKSPSKEKVAVKAPSKEKVKADTKEWKFMIKQLRSELMQLSQKNKGTWQMRCLRLEENE